MAKQNEDLSPEQNQSPEQPQEQVQPKKSKPEPIPTKEIKAVFEKPANKGVPMDKKAWGAKKRK